MGGQPLAFDALDRGFGAVNVAAPKTDAVIVTEAKLREITVHTPLARTCAATCHQFSRELFLDLQAWNEGRLSALQGKACFIVSCEPNRPPTSV
jgi:hypothetical protein